MIIQCPHCFTSTKLSVKNSTIIRKGFFRRKSDAKYIQRFRCLNCKRGFSRATTHAFYRQNKRHVNFALQSLLCSGVSQRRAAKLLHINRTTVARKLVVLGRLASQALSQSQMNLPKAEIIEFDDMETFEHTKMKPLSITLAVEHNSRRILGFEVSRMNSKGLLTSKGLKKYGKRKDERSVMRKRLFENLKPLVVDQVIIKSDESPHYVDDVRTFFPNATHERFKGQRGSIVGQGELKKIRFDPLFSINHTCAMLRANMSRLFRKTWCTTKKPQNLYHHIAIYALYHNFRLTDGS